MSSCSFCQSSGFSSQRSLWTQKHTQESTLEGSNERPPLLIWPLQQLSSSAPNCVCFREKAKGCLSIFLKHSRSSKTGFYKEVWKKMFLISERCGGKIYQETQFLSEKNITILLQERTTRYGVLGCSALQNLHLYMPLGVQTEIKTSSWTSVW